MANSGKPSDQEAHAFYHPPTGPPPQQQQQQQQQHHSNDTPIPDYDIPAYDPANPTFAQPPTVPYGASEPRPTSSHATQAAPTKHSSAHGSHGSHGFKSRSGFADRLSALGTKAASPINLLANKMGSEGFLPSTMEDECEKAARIIRGFCKDGIQKTESSTSSTSTDRPSSRDGVKAKKALITIPAKVLRRAVGLAIFTTGRVGFHMSGSTGSGVLIARMTDGSWSPPSGIQIHSLGAGFSFGADIYDCVLVLNSQEALDAFRNTRLSLGSDLAVTAGPWGAGGSLEIAAPESKGKGKRRDSKSSSPPPGAAASAASAASAAPSGSQATDDSHHRHHQHQSSLDAGKQHSSKDRKPSPLRKAASQTAYSYIKSRGVYAGVQVDGTVVTVRNSANTLFYGAEIPVSRILHGEVPAGKWSQYGKILLDAVYTAEGNPPTHHAGSGVPPPETSWASAAPAAIINPGTDGHPASFPPPPAQPPQGYQQGYQQGYPQQQQGSPQGYQQGSSQGYQQGYPQGQPPQQPYQAQGIPTGGFGTRNVESSAPTTTPAAGSKAAEAAAESSAQPRGESPPPGYSVEAHSSSAAPTDSLPPAYVDDGRTHPGTGDHKTGH